MTTTPPRSWGRWADGARARGSWGPRSVGVRRVGVYVIRLEARGEFWGAPAQAEAAALLELPHPPQSPASIRSDPSPLRDVEVPLAGWGLPRLDAEILDSAPRLRLVPYCGGSPRPFLTPELWRPGNLVVTPPAAHPHPLAPVTLA